MIASGYSETAGLVEVLTQEGVKNRLVHLSKIAKNNGRYFW